MKKSLFLLPVFAGLVLCGCSFGGGKGTSLQLTIDYDSISEAIGSSKTGYDAVSEIEDLDGYEVEIENVCINMLNSQSIPPWNTPEDEEVNVLQFASPTGSRGNGSITFFDVKVNTVTIYLYTSYSISKDFKVTIGDTSIKMKKDSGEATDYQSVDQSGNPHDISLYALTFNCGGASGDLVIQNQGNGARYVQSIEIE